ncbi:hypothetical protein ACFQ1I_34685 [Kitasatospora arboriphila]
MTPLYAGLFDDAALFPPGDLPLAEAVPPTAATAPPGTRRRSARSSAAPASWRTWCAPPAPARCRSGWYCRGQCGPGHGAQGGRGLDVVSIEIATDDVAATVAQLAAELPEGIAAAVELPRDGRTEDSLDALAGTPTGPSTAPAGSPPGPSRRSASWPPSWSAAPSGRCRTSAPPGCTTPSGTPIR